MEKVWTPARERKLRKLWDEDGKTASQIAAAFGGIFSRSAIIGKARRLGLSRRPSPIRIAIPKKS